MVDKVPVGAANQANVRLENDHPSVRAEQAPNDAKLFDDRIGVRQVLEVVAHEDGAKRRFRQHPGEVETVCLDELDFSREGRAEVAQVGRPALGRSHVANEVAAVAGDIENRLAGVNPATRGTSRSQAISNPCWPRLPPGSEVR